MSPISGERGGRTWVTSPNLMGRPTLVTGSDLASVVTDAWDKGGDMQFGDYPVVLKKRPQDDRNELWQLIVGGKIVAEEPARIGAYGAREERRALAKLIANLMERA